jgi:hypothetical protein
MCNFDYKSSQTYQALDVGRKLLELPKLTERFRQGKIAWSAVREICRVATAETEKEWITFAAGKTSRQVLSEVKDAQEKGRKLPRKDGCSMPNRKMRLPLEFSREEYEVLTKALSQFGQELVDLHGEDKKPDPKSLLLLMARLVLESEPETGLPKGRRPKEDSRFHILYQCCRDCGKAHLVTEEGLVDVPRKHVERLEGAAQVVEIRSEEELPGAGARSGKHRPAIDQPNTPQLVEKVYHRDGMKCAIPSCPHCFHPHCHHIVPRAEGGRTELYNEILVCPLHHGMIHEGILRIERDKDGTLVFLRKGDSVWDILDKEWKETAKSPLCVVAPVAGRGRVNSTRVENSSGGREKIGKAGGAGTGDPEVYAVNMLLKGGCHRDVALARVRYAIDKLRKEGKEPFGDDVVQGACEAYHVFPEKRGAEPNPAA